MSVDEWLEEHPQLKAFLTESSGKAIRGAIWLKDLLSKDKRAKIITMAAGIAVDYGYDKLMAYADIEEAKAELSTFLQKWDSDLNEQQADILAGAAIKFAKEAGRVLTHKYANKGVNVLKDKLKGPEQQPLVFYKEYTSGKKEGVGKVHQEKILSAEQASIVHDTLLNTNLTVRKDIVLSGGRSSQLVKQLTGPPNSVLKGNQGRIFITDNSGYIIFDITKDRVKPVVPGQGFGSKSIPTTEQLNLLKKLWEE